MSILSHYLTWNSKCWVCKIFWGSCKILIAIFRKSPTFYVWGLWPPKWFLEVLSNFFSFNNHPQALRWSLRYRIGVLRFWWFWAIFVILRKILQANNKILQAISGIFFASYIITMYFGCLPCQKWPEKAIPRPSG